jgi:hypothetical protein
LITPEELRHLTEGPRTAETSGGVGLVAVDVTTPGEASDLLRRCREVLREVLETAMAEEWPAEDTWAQRLPDWFVQACAAEETAEEAARWLAKWRELDDEARVRAARERPWSLPDWLYWLQPDERQWFWWDAVVRGKHEARIFVEVPGWPVALGALEWLLRAAGADSINVADDLVK